MTENKFARLWLEDKILVLEYTPGLEIDLCVAKEIICLKLQIVTNESLPLLLKLNQIKSISKEAREFMAKVGTCQVLASALLWDSPVSKILGSFYISINKPAIPTKLFPNPEEAKSWLMSFYP